MSAGNIAGVIGIAAMTDAIIGTTAGMTGAIAVTTVVTKSDVNSVFQDAGLRAGVLFF